MLFKTKQTWFFVDGEHQLTIDNKIVSVELLAELFIIINLKIQRDLLGVGKTKRWKKFTAEFPSKGEDTIMLSVYILL